MSKLPIWTVEDDWQSEGVTRCLFGGHSGFGHALGQMGDGLEAMSGTIEKIDGVTVFIDERLDRETTLAELALGRRSVPDALWRRASSLLLVHSPETGPVGGFTQQTSRSVVLSGGAWLVEHIVNHELAHLCVSIENKGFVRFWRELCEADRDAYEGRGEPFTVGGVVGGEIKVGEERISAYANSYLVDPDVRARHAARIRQLPLELTSSEDADPRLQPAFFETEADDQSVGEDFCESVALFLANQAHGRLPVRFAACFPHRAQALEALFLGADGSWKRDLSERGDASEGARVAA
jgi:hypothetical protein